MVRRVDRDVPGCGQFRHGVEPNVLIKVVEWALFPSLALYLPTVLYR